MNDTANRAFLLPPGIGKVSAGAVLLAVGVFLGIRGDLSGGGFVYPLAGLALLVVGLVQLTRAGVWRLLIPRKSSVEQVLELDDDLSWFWPPQNLHDPAAWDLYWTNQLKHGLGPQLSDMLSNHSEVIELMKANELRTVLCVGNGISEEPSVLAKAGFDVTALDLSPLAMRFARETQADSVKADRYVVGDVMDGAICPGPFDVIIERRTLQLFPEAERTQAIAAITNRLARKGLLVSHCHDGRWKPPGRPKHSLEKDFRKGGWKIWEDGAQLDGRAVLLSLSTG